MSAPDSSRDLMKSGLPGRAMDREILRLAVPAILQYLLHTFQFLIDTRMVSDASGGGDEALASLNLVSPLCWSLTTIFTVTAIGAGAVVARRTGEGDALRSSQALWTSLGLATFLGLLVTLLCVAGRDMGMNWLGQEMFDQDPQSRARILHCESLSAERSGTAP